MRALRACMGSQARQSGQQMGHARAAGLCRLQVSVLEPKATLTRSDYEHRRRLRQSEH